MRKSLRGEKRTPRRVLIAGRGVAGLSLADDVRESGDVVVGFLDDQVVGTDVVGGLGDVARVCVEHRIEAVYFAIPSASPQTLQSFIASMPHGVEFAALPREYRIVLRERVSVADLTDVDVLDLVGRAPVKHDVEAARSIIRGRRVMVTGAAGSIGSRILQQLLDLDPEAIIGVDRSEAGIFHLGQALGQRDRLRLAIADVQSEGRIRQLIDEHRPDFLFHVAAYKHVPLMQENPVEAFNNNVWGTLNVLRQAAIGGVRTAVYVSTDKAVKPTNVMGATKRLGELMLRDLAAEFPGTRFNGVRFGNVLESEGSVMQTFRRQLQAGEPLTVTHEDITRYFMTIDEAAQLVIQCAAAGTPGDLFVLDMGEPIRVIDLAHGLIKAVNPALDVQIIGLRPGEKMFEELNYDSSQIDSTTHPKIFVVKEQQALPPGAVIAWVEDLLTRTTAHGVADDELVQRMREFGFAELR